MNANYVLFLLCVVVAIGVRYCWLVAFGPEPGRHSWQKAALNQRPYEGRRRKGARR